MEAQKQQSNAQDVEHRLKLHSLKDRVRIRDFFKDFDKRRAGHVSQAHFRTALGYTKMHFVENDFVELIRRYQDAQNPDRVNYSQLCDNIEAIFTEKELEKKPLHTFSTPAELVNRAPIQLSPEEEQNVEMLLARLRERVQIRRLLVKPAFQDFDRKAVNKTISKFCHGVGCVTRDQFKQGLSNAFAGTDFSAADYNLLFKKFYDNGDVNYIDFSAAVDPELYNPGNNGATAKPRTPAETQQLGQSFGAMALGVNLDQEDTELADVINKMKHKVYTERIRVHEAFSDFDKLRDGCVTIPQFRTCLDTCRFTFSESVFPRLVALFRVHTHPNHVCWTAFADMLDTVFTQKGLESNPLHEVQGPSRDVFQAHMRSVVLSPERDAQYKKLIEALRELVRIRPAPVRAVFQDFDRGLGNKNANPFCHRLGRLTRTQFQEGLATLFPTFQWMSEHYHLLFDKYDDFQDGTVNYAAFSEDIDPSASKVSSSSTSTSSASASATNGTHAHAGSSESGRETAIAATSQQPTQVDVDVLLPDLMARVFRYRLRCLEFFRDHDPLRTGLITAAKFRTGLEMCRYFALSEKDFKILEMLFADPKSKSIRYKDFCDLMDSVFTQKELERVPTATFQIPYHLLERQRNLLTEAEEQAVEQLLAFLRDDVRMRRVLVKPFFTDHDHKAMGKTTSSYCHGVGRVTQTQFQQVLNAIFPKVDFRDEDYQLLFRRFFDSGDVNYIEFSRAIDPTPGELSSNLTPTQVFPLSR